ncbi:AMP-binding protein [Paenibacillus sp. Marseille-Q4541]|uniref:AMP-binding protein n=1 Tax=Paenibacillus sp. Marseille-Q4541 TaxID=2831522 RepID=UPI0020185BC2|nr:AMP-binding protein [Paenibacillus sp. Marseille-Q4541]
MKSLMSEYTNPKKFEIEYSLDGKRFDNIKRFTIINGIDVLKLFAAAWCFYKSQISGNQSESIHILNKRGTFVAIEYEVDKQQTSSSFMRMMCEHWSLMDELEVSNMDSDYGDILLFERLYLNENVQSGEQTTTVGISMSENSISFLYQFNSELFQENLINRVHRRVLGIALQMASRPFDPLHEISLIDESESKEVLYHFNESKRDYPEDKTMIELFEQQVERNPDHIALEFKGITLTYRELNARANQVGRRLREEGVMPDTIVGIMAQRSVEMIVGIYGVLKAGGAYLPIDPEMPISRMKFMLSDSKSPVLLTGPCSQEKVSQLEDIHIIDLGTFEEGETANLDHYALPEHLAYVIYTSGTTGNPKGVMVENRNLVNFVFWMLEDEYLPDEVILQKTTYAFDLSIWELFVGYMAGAKLVLLPPEDEKEPEKNRSINLSTTGYSYLFRTVGSGRVSALCR